MLSIKRCLPPFMILGLAILSTTVTGETMALDTNNPIKKYRLHDLKEAYYYPTSYVSPEETKRNLEKHLPRLMDLNKATLQKTPTWKRGPVGSSATIDYKDQEVEAIVYDHGFYRLIVKHSQPASRGADTRSYDELFQRATSMAVDLDLIDSNSVGECFGLAKDRFTAKQMLTCDALDMQVSFQSGEKNQSIANVFLTPRIPIGKNRFQQNVSATLRGVGLRVYLDGDLRIWGAEGRPLNVHLEKRSVVKKILAPEDTLAAFNRWVSTPGFDRIQQLTQIPQYGYSALAMEPYDAFDANAMERVHFEDHPKIDELPMPDPALPPPLLRPSYAFGGIGFQPVEPVVLPLNTEVGQIEQIAMSVSSDGKQKHILPLVSIKEYELDWRVVNHAGKAFFISRDADFDVQQLDSDTPVFLWLKDKNFPQLGYVHGASFTVPRSPHDEPSKQLFSDAVSTDTDCFEPGSLVAAAEPKLLNQLTSADVIEGKFNEGPVYQSNFKVTPNFDKEFKVSVEKVRSAISPGLTSLGMVADKIAITHWAFSFDFTVMGDTDGKIYQFRSDLCDLDLRANASGVCKNSGGNYGNTVEKSGNNEMSDKHGYSAQTLFRLAKDAKQNLGFMHLGVSYNTENRADGGPMPYQNEMIKWVGFLESMAGTDYLNVETNVPLTELTNLKRHLPKISARIRMLGRSRPSITPKLDFFFRPKSCLLVKEIRNFCDPAGKMKPIIGSSSEKIQSYCDLPDASSDHKQVTITQTNIYAYLEVRHASQENVGMYLTELHDSPLPLIEKSLGDGAPGYASQTGQNSQTMVNLLDFTPIPRPTIFGLTDAAVAGSGGVLHTFRPLTETQTKKARFKRLTPSGKNYETVGTWDNIHQKDYNGSGRISQLIPTETTPRSIAIPGNIVVPGCSNMIPYKAWPYRERPITHLEKSLDAVTTVNDVDKYFSAIFAINDSKIDEYFEWLSVHYYLWDPVPNCIHEHSNWALDSKGNFDSFFDINPVLKDYFWSFVKADYSAEKGLDLKEFRPVSEGYKNVNVCTQGEVIPIGNGTEFKYICQPLTRYTVQRAYLKPLKVGHLFNTPIFFTE